MKLFGEVKAMNRRMLGMLAMVFGAVVAPAWGEVGQGERVAILVGVEDYQQDALDLVWTANDVRELEETLSKKGGYRVWKFTEQEAPQWRATRENLQRRLPGLLEKLKPEDTLIFYLDGHGLLGKDGALYFAPEDCDWRSPERTGVAVAWLREQLARCRAGLKVLILDVCHAGSQKEGAVEGVSGQEMGRLFQETPGVYVLASCRAEEKSFIWEAKRQSLFSYWVNQGLQGHADLRGNGFIRPDDLFDYVQLHVPDVANRIFGRLQQPDRTVGPEVREGRLLEVRPGRLRGLLGDMAEQLSTIIQIRGLKLVGVPEFAQDTRAAELVLGGDFGVLGRWCATELTGQLALRSGGQFEVLNQEVLQKRLRDKGVTVRLVSRHVVKGLEAEGKPVGALVLGILRSRVVDQVQLQCELRGMEGQVYGVAGGAAYLNVEERAMMGGSGTVSEVVLPDPQGSPDRARIAKIDEATQGPHPLADPSFPYRLRIMVNGKEREGVFHGNRMYVPLREGEVYQIQAENRDARQVCLRLLVDGLSTLPERARFSKGVFVEPLTEQEYLPAQRVSLEEAHYWTLPPPAAGQAAGVGVIQGFYRHGERRAQGRQLYRYNEFVVVDAPSSAAARQGYTEQLGVITAAFYAAERSDRVRARGPVGTALGQEKQVELAEYQVRPGTLLTKLEIHYLPPEELQRVLSADRPAEK